MSRKERGKRRIGVGSVKISRLEKQYVNEALKNNRLSYGPLVRQFEKEWSSLHNVKYAIFCNSGTSALQVAVHALKILHEWHDGDEIIMPAVNFISDPNIVWQNQLKPVFVDVDPEYYTLDPTKIEVKITPKTRAIMPVHLCGLPADMQPIMRLARRHNLRVIEDSCETVLAQYQGKPVGSFSDVSCFSTYAAHIIVTGVGGFVCTNNGQLAVLVKSLMNHGRDGIYLSMDDDNVADPDELFKIVQRRFRFLYPGYSYRATELEGALGLGQLKRAQTIIKKRQQNAAYLSKGLANLQEFLQLPKIRPHSTHSFMMYPVVLKTNVFPRSRLVYFLEKLGIETRYLLPLINQPVVKKMYLPKREKFPVASWLNKKAFYVGCTPELTKQDLDYMISTFFEFFRKEKLV